ncbi:MAG TPA: hypothetical protein VF152_10580 [Acidimicrobiia bacterium]
MRRLGFVAAACAIVLAGCEVDTTVSIDVRDDGSGTVAVRVALDADAVSEAEAGGATLEDRVRLGDLEAAGWASTGWRRQSDGGAQLRISKEFADADDLAGVIAELNGPNGPLRDVSLSVDDGVVFDRYRLRGEADLSDLRTGVLEDPELVAALTAQQVDLTALDLRLLDQLQRSFHMRVVVSLPGKTSTFAPEPGEAIELSASSRQFDPGRPLLLAAAAVSAALALLVFLRGRRVDRRRRRRNQHGSRS